MTSHKAWLDDLRIARAGKGPPMLMLHGGGGPLDGAPFFAALAESFSIVAPTHPGFAASPLPDGCDSVHDLAYLYLDLMDALDLREVTLMGFSFGGWVAAEIAIRSTARLARLVLVDSVGIKVGDRETRDIVDLFIHSEAELDKLRWHDPSRAPDPATLSEEDQRGLAYNKQALALYGWEPYLHNPKLKGRLHRIDVPTLVVWGESDRIVSPQYGAALCDAIPGAGMVVIPEAGHAPQIEQPASFVDHVRNFAR